jgi:uncharacterized membrane protein YoaK (UPF0700 family)
MVTQQTLPGTRAASLLLSMVAGYVDSCTFLSLFGLFVAQVTGSFVAAGAQIARGEHGFLLTTFAIPIFLAAGAATTLLVEVVERRRGRPLAWTLGVEGALIGGFFIAGVSGAPFGHPDAPLAMIAGLFGLLAMGVQSAMVQLIMRGTPSTNVMTTNTTQLAILATRTVLCWHAQRRNPGSPAAAQLASSRDRLTAVLLVAAGFLAGTIAGALAYSAIELWCLLAPVAAIIGLVIWSLQLPPPGPQDHQPGLRDTP